MAATALGRRLTEQHRQRQLVIRARVLQTLIALWPLFDPRRIDETWALIEPALMVSVEQGRRDSEAAAQAYYAAVRRAEGVAGTFAVPRTPTPWQAATQTSLLVTGPVRAKGMVARNLPGIADQTLVSLSGALGRQVTRAGNDLLVRAVRGDRAALGWARVGSADPCAFCAMLIGRGAAYRTRDTASFEAHDHCACTVSPVFSRNEGRSPQARRFADLWNETTRYEEGPAAQRAAFRRAYEASRHTPTG